MKVLILKASPKIGMAGEVKEVKDGYARNHLIPLGIACLANEHNLAIFSVQKKKLKKKTPDKKEKKLKKKIKKERVENKL